LRRISILRCYDRPATVALAVFPTVVTANKLMAKARLMDLFIALSIVHFFSAAPEI